jgi:hypothetical protein
VGPPNPCDSPGRRVRERSRVRTRVYRERLLIDPDAETTGLNCPALLFQKGKRILFYYNATV